MSHSKKSIPEIGEGKRGPDGYLGYLLWQASNAQRARMEKALADMAITPPQFSVLTMINAYPAISGADLARITMLTPQTVSVIVANLEKINAIQRQQHSSHGRKQTLVMSESGRALMAAARQRVQLVEQDLNAGLNEQEAAIVRRWLVSSALKNKPQ